MSAAEINRTIREMFEHLGISFIDMLRVGQYRGQQDIDRYFEINNKEHLRTCYGLVSIAGSKT